MKKSRCQGLRRLKRLCPLRPNRLKRSSGLRACVRGHGCLKKPRVRRMPAEADTLKKVVRGYVPGGTGARHLKKYTRYKRLPAGRRKSLKRSSGLRTERTGVRLPVKAVYTR